MGSGAPDLEHDNDVAPPNDFWQGLFESWWAAGFGEQLPTFRDLAPTDADIPDDELDDPEDNANMQRSYDWWRRHRFKDQAD